MNFREFIINKSDKILILDFGSKRISDLTNRLRTMGIFCEVRPFTMERSDIVNYKPKGIILSGSSIQRPVMEIVSEPSDIIYKLNIPVLGICYGMEIMSKQLGGIVAEGEPEIGITYLTNRHKSKLLGEKNDSLLKVWMHHKDDVIKMPDGFIRTASTNITKNAVIENDNKRYYGVQFHPEGFTSDGICILRNFIDICECVPSSSLNFHDEFYLGTKSEGLNMKISDITEATIIPQNVTIEEILKMYDAARRGISILNKIKDKSQRKHHASNIFKNLNVIKSMIMKMTDIDN